MRLTPPPEVEEVPGQFWKDFIRETAPVFRHPTIEQLAEFIAPTFQALIDGARYVDDRLLEIIDEVEPDLLVEDNVVSFPALLSCGRPWARIASCNPAEMKDPAVPPTFSGLPEADRSGWEEFWDAYREALGEMHADVQRVLPGAGRASAARRRLHPREPAAEPLSLPGRDRLPARRAAGRSLAQPRGQRPGDRPGLGAAAGAGRARGAAGLPQPRLARLGRRLADAEAGRRAGRTRPTG